MANVTQRCWFFSSSICIQFGGVLLWIAHLIIHKIISFQSSLFINLSWFSLSQNWNPDDIFFFIETSEKDGKKTPWHSAGPLLLSLVNLPLRLSEQPSVGCSPWAVAARCSACQALPFWEMSKRVEWEMEMLQGLGCYWGRNRWTLELLFKNVLRLCFSVRFFQGCFFSFFVPPKERSAFWFSCKVAA